MYHLPYHYFSLLVCFCYVLFESIHVGYVQLSCFRGGTTLFATFFNVSMATHVTALDVHVKNL